MMGVILRVELGRYHERTFTLRIPVDILDMGTRVTWLAPASLITSFCGRPEWFSAVVTFVSLSVDRDSPMHVASEACWLCDFVDIGERCDECVWIPVWREWTGTCGVNNDLLFVHLHTVMSDVSVSTYGAVLSIMTYIGALKEKSAGPDDKISQDMSLNVSRILHRISAFWTGNVLCIAIVSCILRRPDSYFMTYFFTLLSLPLECYNRP